MPISADAILGAIVTIGLAALLGFWKLATMLAEVRGQVRHNGGSSLKDDARTAAQETIKAREMAEKVAGDLAEFRQHQAEDTAETRQAIGRVQHDVTNVRAGQEMLLSEQLALKDAQDDLKRRHEDHRDRNVQTFLNLTRAVDALDTKSAARDDALGEALKEQLDVTIAVQDATEETP